MDLDKNSRIGIWGFGIVGKSAAEYFYNQGHQVSIMDKRIPTAQEAEYLKTKNITWRSENEQETFFNSCEIIIPSPGINISQQHYATHRNKWLHELDIFYHNFHKPIIAVTGSIGKTSTVHLLGQLFKTLSIPAVVGGNIGIPMLDLIPAQNDVDYAILEVSSFQLLYCTHFAPQLAILTNVYPNHLDHHTTEAEYFSAKQNIFRYQKDTSISLLPFILRTKSIKPANEHIRAYFTVVKPHDHELAQLTASERVYYIENNTVMRFAGNTHTHIFTLTPELFNFSFIDNILLLTSVCDLIHIDAHALQTVATTTILPEHRVEKISTFNSIDFYNDSKATTTASTLAAVEKLHHHPLHLFIGGLSKGVDRAPFIAQLKSKVKRIYCFGQEANALYTMCINNGIPASHHPTLEDAINKCFSMLSPHDCVVLSPAGSSYDLYENYEERGKHFKKLVMDYIHTHTSDGYTDTNK